MSFDRRTVAITIISLAAVMSAYLVTDAWKTVHRGEPPGPKTIDVPGQATRHLTPDEVSFIVTVHGRGADQAQATSKLRAHVAAVQASLHAHGIADAELDSTSVSASDTSDTTYDDSGNPIAPAADAWDATQEIDVVLKDIKRGVAAHQAIANVDAVDDADVTEATCSANVLDPTKDALLREARQNVRKQAMAALQQYGGGKLGRLVSASIGSIDVGSDCSDIVLTASAEASYELK
jgi:uncharacterized protein YggE